MSMNAKSFREKMEALYKGVDPLDKKQDDVKLLHGERLSYIQKERYSSESKEEREERLRNISQGWAEKQGTLTLEQKVNLTREYWTCPREDSDIQMLAEKYNVNISYVRDCSYEGKYLDPFELKSLKQGWIDTYGLKYEVISPGNDMLEYYDEQNELRSESMKLLLPPSVVFHYRFRETNWKPKEVKAKFPYIKGNTLLSLLRNRMDWLVDTPSKRFVTQSLDEAEQFYEDVTGLKATSGIRRLAHEGVMGWQGHLGGWVVKHLGGKRFQ